MNKPNINVTPLIDVLLVLLIIFMVITPLKPTVFEAKIPQELKDINDIKTNDEALVVALERDLSLRLNNEKDVGTAENTEKLVERLKFVFDERKKNGVYAENLLTGGNLSTNEKIEKTVFIKALPGTDFGSVAKVIDAVKFSGADPISLQIDRLH